MAWGRGPNVPCLRWRISTLVDFDLFATGGKQTNDVRLRGLGHRALDPGAEERLQQQVDGVLTGFELAIDIPQRALCRPSQSHLAAVHVGDENLVNGARVGNGKIGAFDLGQISLSSLKPPHSRRHHGEGNEDVQNAQIGVHDAKVVYEARPNNRLRVVNTAPATMNTTRSGIPTATNCHPCRSCRMRSSSSGLNAIDLERTLIRASSCNK